MFERRHLSSLERTLDDDELSLLSPYFQSSTLNAARIIEESVPFWLRKNMCAVVLNNRVYLRIKFDKPIIDSVSFATNIELLAHELTHVEQYLSGMTIFKYLLASHHRYWKNPYEVEAYTKAAFVRAQILSKFHFSTFQIIHLATNDVIATYVMTSTT